MKTKQIQAIICKSEILKGSLPCENVTLYYILGDNEFDVLSLNKSGFLTEFEVKISRSDFKADAKKKKWEKYQQRIPEQTPNYFNYVCPEGLIEAHEVPEYAGLIYVDNLGALKVIRKAKLLHSYKQDSMKILTKFYRLSAERQYLGSCRFAYERNLKHPYQSIILDHDILTEN
jgi:hypothetical protein